MTINGCNENLQAHVLQEQGNLIELLDPALKSDYSWKKAITILDLVMMCTNPSPTLMATMSEVVKIMEGKSKIITSKISVPYPMDEFTTAKATPQSRSTSQEGASNTTLSHSVSKEIEESTLSADYTAKMINGQRGISTTESS
ncbi:unnamed protein product [Ilex paraguariensis]|uniref:Uncharacterized protein n=1 Tax=Ilex paraguariensis TaxID=185542 RepID=A0ABC8UHV5_9AQUA